MISSVKWFLVLLSVCINAWHKNKNWEWLELEVAFTIYIYVYKTHPPLQFYTFTILAYKALQFIIALIPLPHTANLDYGFPCDCDSFSFLNSTVKRIVALFLHQMPFSRHIINYFYILYDTIYKLIYQYKQNVFCIKFFYYKIFYKAVI